MHLYTYNTISISVFQHCELLIQSLQTKTLELQERLAVALEVDEAKDEAIVKFHEAWENVANRLEVAEKEKSELKAEMESLIIKNQQELQDAFTVSFEVFLR